jgi:GH18 family chitinase
MEENICSCDFSCNVAKGQYDMAKDLKTANPDLKILLAIGGWNKIWKIQKKIVKR